MTPNESKIRVLIYCRFALFREGLRALLQQVDRIEVIGEAATARQALRLAERFHPDVLLLEPAAAGLDGSEVVRRIKALDPKVYVLILSSHDDERLVAECLMAGASGCIRKGAESSQLKSAIYASKAATFAA